MTLQSLCDSQISNLFSDKCLAYISSTARFREQSADHLSYNTRLVLVWLSLNCTRSFSSPSLLSTLLHIPRFKQRLHFGNVHDTICLLYTSDAADEEDSVDLGCGRIIKKKNKECQ